MKVGDTFKHKTTGNEYKILQNGFRSVITIMDLQKNRLYDSSTMTVEDVTNITKEEFISCIGNVVVYSYLDGSELFPEPTYRFGDIFEDEHKCRYMLTQVGYGMFCLVKNEGYDRGNRQVEAIKVDDGSKITWREIEKMCGNHVKNLKLVDKGQKR